MCGGDTNNGGGGGAGNLDEIFWASSPPSPRMLSVLKKSYEKMPKIVRKIGLI